MAAFSDPAFYGDRWAAVYDQRHADLDPAATAEFLAGLAGGGRVLELAIGTGRVALPLAARGVTVEGLDASAAMVSRLRAKPGGADIPVTIGDMAEVPVDGSFTLVYLVFNALFGLLTQDQQAACFRNVARALRPAGLPPVSGYSHAVTFSGRIVVISGQVPADGAGALVGQGDPT